MCFCSVRLKIKGRLPRNVSSPVRQLFRRKVQEEFPRGFQEEEKKNFRAAAAVHTSLR